ncbi:hypothetical protein ABAC460_23080 [Asticcacaulis sp. AC460]|uniref:phage tail length tape measure family protein n=1 Tax=Asticcacaulis sp. AC460 TaxID=1282360 RepID=UPI0003C40D7F|nr:phage tail length tape measure family protein [Asticcacaulis sp. AC460]ESQ86598.1 hypothetical protein ABAC460_23080 [Asticcacaulis sp. AC460]
MSIRLGEAHYQFTIDDDGLVAGLKRARARVRTEANAMAADIRRVGASFDALGTQADRAGRRAGAELERIRRTRQSRTEEVDATPPAAGGNRGANGRPPRSPGRFNDLISEGASAAESLMSGTSLAMAALQHGPKLLDALAAAGIRVSAAFGPIGVIVAAVGTAIIGLGANALRTERDLTTFNGQIAALAHGSSFNAEALTDVARALDAQGASAESARQAVSVFLREGVHPERIGEFGNAATHLSKVLGIDLVGASQQVSDAFTGNYDDVVKLDDSLHFLTDSERTHIQALFDSGKASDARNEAFRIFTETYAKAYNDSLTAGENLTRSLSGAWDNLVQSIANIGPIKDATDAIGDLVNQLANWVSQFAEVETLTQDQLQVRGMKNMGALSVAEKRLADATKNEANFRGIIYDRNTGKTLPQLQQEKKNAQAEVDRLNEEAGKIAKVRSMGEWSKPTTDTTVDPPKTKRNARPVARSRVVAQADMPVMTIYTVLEQLPESLRTKVKGLLSAHLAAQLDDLRKKAIDAKEGPLGPPRQEDVGVLKQPNIVPFEESLKDIPRLATPIKDMAFEIGTSFSDAFGRAVAGMTTFEEAFKSTLQNMVAKWASSGFEKILGMLIGGNAAQDAGYGHDGIFGGGGIFGQGGGSGTSGGWMTNLMDFAGFRAGGGPVEAGRAYVVGEKRPELFVPRVSGTIMPHVNAAAGGPMIVRVEVDKSKYFDVHVNAVSARNARAAAGRAVEIANQTAYGSVRRSDTYEAA